MIRHIFMARFKDEVTEEQKKQEVADMKAMKDKIPGVVALEVGITTGWVGMNDGVTMTVDFAKKEDFDRYMTHPYHADYINQTGIDLCVPESFAVAQFEF